MAVIIKVRSPNYPAIDLAAALDLTRKLYDHAQRIALPVGEVVVKCWDFKVGGYADQCIGAVRSFGLVDVEGQGEARKLRVTAEAARILDNTNDRPELLRKAALLPRVHASVWGRFGNEGKLPADSVIAGFLVHEYDPPFNRAKVGLFIKQFRKTLSFAAIGEGDIIEPDAQVEESAREDRPVVEPRTGIAPRSDPPRRQPGMNQEIFALEAGNVTLQWPATMSKAEYDDFAGWLEIIKRKASRAVVKPETPVEQEQKPA